MYLYSARTEYRPTILMYHSVDNNKYFFTVSKNEFKGQINILLEKGHNFKNMEDIYNGNYNNKSIVITFDDGYKDNLTNALPILEKYNIPATIYIATSFIGKKEHGLEMLNSENIKFLSNHPLIEIGSHTHSHTDLSKMNDTQIHKDIIEAKNILENMTGKEILHFSYPRGRYNQKVLQIIKEQTNIKTATTVKPGFVNIYNNNFLELNRMSIDKGKYNFIINYLTKKGIERYF